MAENGEGRGNTRMPHTAIRGVNAVVKFAVKLSLRGQIT